MALQTDNAAADERFTGKSVVQQSVRGAMCAPLLAEGDEVLGLLYVDNLATPGRFSEEDLQFLAAFAGIAAGGIRAARSAERAQREAMMRSNFERYFAPSVAADIAGRQGAIQLGGARQPVTVLFSDIRGFTALAESMAPDAIAGLLSAYFTEMVDVIFDHGGTLDKFIGDAIMAQWGAPIRHPDDAERALAAAVGMLRAVQEINARWIGAGPADHQRRDRDQPRRGVRGEHRQPPPPGVHRHRRRGERGLAALLGGSGRRNPAHRVVPAAAGQEEARRGAGRGNRNQGTRRQGHGLSPQGLSGRAQPCFAGNEYGAPASASRSSTNRIGNPITPKKSPSIRSTSAAP